MKIIIFIFLISISHFSFSQNYELFENVKFQNNLKIDSISTTYYLKEKPDCFKKNKKYDINSFELDNAYLRNDSITVLINNKIVFNDRIKTPKYNIFPQTLFKTSRLDTIQFPIKMSILYHDSYKKVSFKIPKGTKRTIIKSYINKDQQTSNEEKKIDNFVKVRFSRFNFLYYHYLINCK